MLTIEGNSIFLDGVLIPEDLIAGVEWNRPERETTPTMFGCPMSHVRTFAPGFETRITLHLKDGRTLKTTHYN